MKVDNNGGEFVDLPDGWMRCDGSVIPHGSIWEGKIVPNLNGERRFLRGGNDGDVLKLEDDQIQSHEHIFNDPGHTHVYDDEYMSGPTAGVGPDNSDHNLDKWDHPHSRVTNSAKTGISVGGVSSSARHGDETRVKNMNIIWIIRIW